MAVVLAALVLLVDGGPGATLGLVHVPAPPVERDAGLAASVGSTTTIPRAVASSMTTRMRSGCFSMLVPSSGPLESIKDPAGAICALYQPSDAA